MTDSTSDAGPLGGTGVEGSSGGDDRGQSTPAPGADHLTVIAEAAEAAVLGAMLLDNEARTGIPLMLTPADFYREAHRVVYSAVLAMLNDAILPDSLTVTAKLAERGQLDEVGGPVAVSDLCSLDVCPVPVSWPTYATVVAREARRRRGIKVLRAALARLEDGEDPAVIADELAVDI